MFYTEENPIFKQTPYGNWKHSCLEDALEKIEQIKRVPFGTLRILAPRVGLEPTTLRLTAECSTIELLRKIAQHLLCHNLKRNSTGFSTLNSLIRFKPILLSCCVVRTFKTAHKIFILTFSFLSVSKLTYHCAFWISLRPISNSQLHTLLYFHLCPIYLILSEGS